MSAARLLRLLAGQLPALPGAACTGPDAGLWDAWTDGSNGACETTTDRAVRHRQAARICLTRCPVIDRCRLLRDTHPALAHDDGVWAGRLYEGRRVTDLALLPELRGAS